MARSSTTVFSSPGRVLTAISLLMLIALMDTLGFFEGPNRHFYDLFFRLRGPRPPSRDVLIAAVDEETLRGLGQWPIRRRHYADLIDRLHSASVVALDIIMDEPSDPEDDRLLTEAIARHGRVVLPKHLQIFRHSILPHEPLFVGRALGHIHVEEGIDGVTREVFHTMTYEGQAFPSLAFAVQEILSGHRASAVRRGPEALVESETGLITQSDRMIINYYGSGGTFPRVSVLSLLQGHCPPSSIMGKVVLVGLTAPPGDGETLTPFYEGRSRMAGVEVHATILSNLLDGSFIRRVSDWWLRGMVLLVGACCLAVFPRLTPGRLALAWLGIVTVLSYVLFRFFVSDYLWVPTTPLYAATLYALAFVYVLKLQQTQDSLRASQRDWEESFHTIDDAIVIHNHRCAVVRANRAGTDLSPVPVMQRLEDRCRHLSGNLKGLPAREEAGPEQDAESIPPEELQDDANDRWYEIRSVPRKDSRQRFVGVVHVVRDITSRKRYEREQRELQVMLSQAQKMEAIGSLAGGIAHDFNNILAGIMGYTEIVYHQLPERSDLRTKLEQVLAASIRARDVINQLLTFSRQGAHEKEVLPIAPLVSEVLKLVRAMLPATIEIQQAVRSSAAVFADPTQIHQVLLNLSTNAFHAMKEKGGVLFVSLDDVALDEPLQLDGQILRAGPYVKLTVGDTGYGIPEELRHRIFEPYFTTKTSGEGTGLGLATVRGIVRDHAGLITYTSEPGKGTRFDLYFPRLESSLPEALTEAADALPRGQGRVLFVDDEPDLTDLVGEMLVGLGYQVTCTNDPLEALELFRAAPDRFDIVITDMSMPKMTGEHLSKALISQRPDIPIILCTGYGDALIRERAFASGARKLITKPFKLKELAKALGDLT